MTYPISSESIPLVPASGRGIPITVMTGFLGAGKTTLIRALLADEAAANTALVVNEFGEVGIDDVLLREASEQTVLIGNGCVCCAARSDLHKALRDLFAERRAGTIPNFERVIIETSGLADPTPVLQVLATDRTLAVQYELAGLVTVVDSVNGGANASTSEWSKQVALADRIVITKTDIADAGALADLEAMLDGLAPLAPRLRSQGQGATPAFVLARPDKTMRIATEDQSAHAHVHDHAHTQGYSTFTISRSAPLSWSVLAESLDVLGALCGANLLRLKGFARVRGRRGPVVVQRVQHLACKPELLAAWPDGIEGTQLVIIGRGLDVVRVRTLLEAVWAFDGDDKEIAAAEEDLSCSTV